MKNLKSYNKINNFFIFYKNFLKQFTNIYFKGINKTLNKIVLIMNLHKKLITNY